MTKFIFVIASIILMIESAMNEITRHVGCLLKSNRSSINSSSPQKLLPYINVLPKAYESYNRQIQAELKNTTFSADCGNWYRNDKGVITNNWSGYALGYIWLTKRVKTEDFDQVSLHLRSCR
jgi:hypothetical protein